MAKRKTLSPTSNLDTDTAADLKLEPQIDKVNDTNTDPVASLSATLQRYTYDDGTPPRKRTRSGVNSNITTTPAAPTASSPLVLPGAAAIPDNSAASPNNQNSSPRKELIKTGAKQPSISSLRNGLKRNGLKRSGSSGKGSIQKNSGYAPPSTYAHLPHLEDVLAPNLLIVFVGLNPGIRTATTGHAYSHPSNLFWKLLHSSGCTPRRCAPSEDGTLPARYGLGNTNIVTRPTRHGGELRRQELLDSVAALQQKIARYRPETVCLVGKAIWESVWQVVKGRAMRKDEFRYGWQDEGDNMGVCVSGDGNFGDVDTESGGGGGERGGELGEQRVRDPTWKGARVFVATTTSGLAAGMKPAEKEAVWKPLGEWAIRRRKERGQWIDGGDAGPDRDIVSMHDRRIFP
ncbi:MAG: hypothetical protein M1825_001896 [Sarcosagium campestre]|nr:MAG: hypothetical protein M1825_001896 [Sarcosagium campestre]